MAEFFSELDDRLRRFVASQKMFFVATAPGEGRINLSPKGMDTLRCLDSRTVAYLDLTGSGNETAAHLRENGRVTLMLCSFDLKPMILRIYGAGRVVRQAAGGAGDTEWSELMARFDHIPGARQIVVVDVESVQTSCGYAVPVFGEGRERDTLRRWADKKGESGIRDHWRDQNQVSIDGLETGIQEG